MSEKKQESFTVTDRRLFTSEGELRRELSEEEVSTSKPPATAAAETNVASIASEPSTSSQSAANESAPEQARRLTSIRLCRHLPPRLSKRNRPMPITSRRKNSMPALNSAATPRKKWP